MHTRSTNNREKFFPESNLELGQADFKNSKGTTFLIRMRNEAANACPEETFALPASSNKDGAI
jgi:hypothetical protein